MGQTTTCTPCKHAVHCKNPAFATYAHRNTFYHSDEKAKRYLTPCTPSHTLHLTFPLHQSAITNPLQDPYSGLASNTDAISTHCTSTARVSSRTWCHVSQLQCSFQVPAASVTWHSASMPQRRIVKCLATCLGRFPMMLFACGYLLSCVARLWLAGLAILVVYRPL